MMERQFVLPYEQNKSKKAGMGSSMISGSKLYNAVFHETDSDVHQIKGHRDVRYGMIYCIPTVNVSLAEAKAFSKRS